MNTRNKIVAIADLPPEPATLVIGTFDPMLTVHALRLAQLTHPLVVAVADLPKPILDSRSRQELVAALDVVDFVVPYESGLETAFAWAAIHDDTALHAEWSADFTAHVRSRSR